MFRLAEPGPELVKLSMGQDTNITGIFFLNNLFFRPIKNDSIELSLSMDKFKFADCFDRLHEIAIQATGLEDFGPGDYHEPLRVVLESVDEDVADRFIPHGDKAALGYLATPLISRLHTQDGWNKNPEYKDVKITRPIVILGLPRTGSTGLHKLLSLDPQFQSVPMWLYQRPMVRLPRAEWESHPVYQRCKQDYETSFAGNEGVNKFHDMVLDEADECWWGLQQSYINATMYSGLGLTSYANWWYQQSEHSSYQRYADQLKLIGLNDNRQWLLKNPYHLLQSQAVLDTFPDACVIHTHRHPAVTISSFSNLLNASHRIYFGDNLKPRETGMLEATTWMMGIYRTERVRKQHADRFFDVLHSDFFHHPLEVVKNIYNYFGLVLSEAVEQSMNSYVEGQDQARRRGHTYNPTDYGLQDEALNELFQHYIAKYIVSSRQLRNL